MLQQDFQRFLKERAQGFDRIMQMDIVVRIRVDGESFYLEFRSDLQGTDLFFQHRRTQGFIRMIQGHTPSEKGMHGSEFDLEFLFQPFQFTDQILILQSLLQKG